MQPSPASPSQYKLYGRRTLLTLLVVSVAINYMDRGNLSVAAHAISRDIPLSAQDQGLLFSAFFWTYACCQFFSGWLFHRFRVTRVFAAGYCIWTAATALTAFAAGLPQLLMLRLVLGIGESVAYPSYSKIIASRFSESERGLANAWIDAGSKSGPAIGVLAAALLLKGYGWRGMFLFFGLAGFIWLIPWIWVTQQAPAVAVETCSEPDAPRFLEILRLRQAWGTFLGLFCGNYTWYFLLTWLPPYFVTERHFTDRMMAMYGPLPFWGVAASSLTCGLLSDRLIRRGASVSRVRRTFVCTGLLLAVLLVPAYLVAQPVLSMALLIVACLCFGLFSSNVWAVTQTIAGPHAAGKWTGMQNAFGNLAGIAAPYITGQIVQHTHSFFFAFLAAAAIAVVGAFSYLLLVGPVRPVDWSAGLREPNS